MESLVESIFERFHNRFFDDERMYLRVGDVPRTLINRGLCRRRRRQVPRSYRQDFPPSIACIHLFGPDHSPRPGIRPQHAQRGVE
jgi:hypothetical protein